MVTGIAIAFLTVANLLAAGLLVADILTNNKVFANHLGGLLAADAVIWSTNVIAASPCAGTPPRGRSGSLAWPDCSSNGHAGPVCRRSSPTLFPDDVTWRAPCGAARPGRVGVTAPTPG